MSNLQVVCNRYIITTLRVEWRFCGVGTGTVLIISHALKYKNLYCDCCMYVFMFPDYFSPCGGKNSLANSLFPISSLVV